MRKYIYIIFIFIFLVLAYASKRSFNVVERPFTHNVEIKVNPNGWKNLDLREKIAQLIMVRINGKFYNSESYYKRNLKKWISEDGIGGIITFSGSIHGTYYNIKDFQEWAEVPLLVASDLERGLGQMMSGGTLFPSNMAVAATQDTSLAYKQGYITATEALSIGAHVIFAPVMDVNNNADNPIINFRAYSDDPNVVSKFGTSFIKGIQDGGAVACAKHYPGHGNTSTDSHTSLPTILGTKEELESMELYPFSEAIKSDVGMIMVGHISMPGLDPSGLASSLSKVISSDILKDEMGFDGIVVTDALEMGGITKNSSAGEACVRAIEAGADIVLLPLDVKLAINSIYDAVQNGRISEDRIDQSVAKIWKQKYDLGILKDRNVEWKTVEDNIGLSDNKKTAQYIANKSITLVKNDKSLVPLKPNKIKKITHLILTTDDSAYDFLKPFDRDLKRTHRNVKKILINDKLSNNRINSIVEDLKGSSVVVVSMLIRIRMDKGESTIDETHAKLLDRLKEENIPTIGVSFGSPYLPSYSSLDAYMCAYGYGSISVKAAANAIWGRSSIEGKLPVNLSEKYKRGHGIELKNRKFSFEPNSNSYKLDLAWDVLENAISSKVFPGAQVVVVKNNKLVAQESFGKLSYDEAANPVNNNSIYDIASITKVLSVTPVTMKLIDQRKLSLDHTIEQYYPSLYNKDMGSISIRHLLTHSSGLKPFVEFYRIDSKMDRDDMLNRIFNTSLDFTPGEKMQYSDLGIIILMDIIEKVSGSSLDRLCNRWIFNPIDMSNTGYNPDKILKDNMAPTEDDDYFRNRLLLGEVHDENAFLLDGVSGHAGIFSTSYDLAKYAQLHLNGGTWLGNRIFSFNRIDEFTKRQELPKGSDRALGWDTPSRNGKSSAGDYFSDHSYGHLGFTGTSLWIDQENEVIVVLLTNRVHPTRETGGMYAVRRQFHTEIMKAIL